MNIRQITSSEYYDKFCTFTTVACNSFINRVSLEGDGIILGYYKDDIPIGVAVLSMHTIDCTIYYLNVKKEERNKGIAQELLKKSIELARENKKGYVECDIITQHECSDIMCHIMDKNKFFIDETFTSYKCFTDKKTNKIWSSFMAKTGQKIIDRAEKHGFICKKFNEVDSETFNFFKNNLKDLFPYGLNPFPIYNQMNSDLSFLTLKNNKPAAFLFARTVNTDPLVVEVVQTAVSKDFKNTYAFSITLLNFITKTFRDNVSFVIFCVSNENSEMLRSTNRFLSDIIRTRKDQIVYKKKI